MNTFLSNISIFSLQFRNTRQIMSNQQTKQRIQVPDSLRDVLLEFSIAYLLEQPGDVIDYAVEFFTKLQANRRTTTTVSVVIDGPPSPDESVMSLDEGKFFIFFFLFSLPSFFFCYRFSWLSFFSSIFFCHVCITFDWQIAFGLRYRIRNSYQ